MTDQTQSLTREIKSDFSAQDLQELVGAAPWAFSVLEIAETTYDRAKEAYKTEDHTEYLSLWNNFIDLHEQKSSMGLDNPRRQVPLHYFYKQGACEHFWSAMEYIVSMAEFADKYWKDSAEVTLKLSVQMLLAIATHKN